MALIFPFFFTDLLQMSGSRMKVAGRFKPCLHMGCFDLDVFVEMNQRSRKVRISNHFSLFLCFFLVVSLNTSLVTLNVFFFFFFWAAVAMPYLSQELCFREYHH